MSLPQLIDSYLAGVTTLRQAIAGLNREQALARPVSGKWSTLEVVCHLADIDALDAERMKRIIALDRPTLMDCDEALYAAALVYQHRDLEGEVTLIDQTRRQMARILRALPAAALTRSSVYRIGDKTEERTLERLLNKAIRHINHHAPFILDKRRALGLSANGPVTDAQDTGPATLQIAPAESVEALRHVRELFTEYAELLRQRHGECCLAEYAKEVADLPGVYAPPDGRLLLAVHQAQVAGCVALRRIDENICEMKRLYVRSAFRAKGIGRMLARAVIAEARDGGYARMCLDTLPSLTEATALYRSLGFSPTGPYLANPTAGAVCFELPLG